MGRGGGTGGRLLPARSVIGKVALPVTSVRASHRRISRDDERDLAEAAAQEQWDGPVQQIERLASGIWKAQTPGHGGLVAIFPLCGDLHATSAELAPFQAQLADNDVDVYCFEEDCDWAILAALRPDIWPVLNGSSPELMREAVAGCLERWQDLSRWDPSLIARMDTLLALIA